MKAPEATVLFFDGYTVKIRCPYCQREHRHRIAQRGYNRLAPACGEFLPATKRAAGYVVLIAGRRPQPQETTP